MNYLHQSIMNDSIRYWSDGTADLSSFGGEYGFRRLLNCAVLELDYTQWEEEERGDKRMFICTLDKTFCQKNRSSLRYRTPQSHNPPPPGMLHIWDILKGGWRTIKIDDYNRVKVKSIFPISLKPSMLVQDERALLRHFSVAQLYDYKIRVFNGAYDLFRRMSPAQKMNLMEEETKIMWLQDYEKREREKIKQEIDEIIDRKLQENEKIIQPQKPQNPVNEIKITNVNEQDTQQATEAYQNLSVRQTTNNDVATTLSSFNNNNQPQKQNVMDNFK